MKLLLVDDEKFTREGILSITPWKELGIDEVITACDGEEGLKKALSFHPEIILTDVKMPHMDGVNMSFRIRESLPECSIIFMSGYADKEYLKSAIRLSAINYIEKPFHPKELQSTLKIAVEKCRERVVRTNTLNLSLPSVKKEIVIALQKPDSSEIHLDEYLQIAYPGLDKSGHWIAFLVLLLDSEEPNSSSGSLRRAICDLLESRLELSDIAGVIIGEKNEQVITVYMKLSDKNGVSIPNSDIGNICYMLCDMLKSTCRFLLATGHPVDCFEEIFRSYQAASICLQRGFFYKENAVLFYEEKHNHLVYQFSDTSLAPFEKALRQHDEAAAKMYITNLVKTLRRFDGTLVSSVKNFFLLAAQSLYETAALCGSRIFEEEGNLEVVNDKIWNMSFLTEIEQYFMSSLEKFFCFSDDGYVQNPLAYQIRRYIDENYESEDLSLQEIATQFSVSESYVCIIFKKVFDTTVNQYIIDNRMEKAIYYLKNTNKKIKEISTLVGYRDCNYFIRIFKKNTGRTPTDYRSS